MTLFLPFAAEHHSVKIDSLKLEHLSSDLILDFLNKLESGRSNTAKTRNHRLAVLKSFAKMVSEGKPISEIKNRLGHSNVQSTMVYLQLDLNQKRQLQDDFIKFTRQHLASDPKIDELIQWENKQDVLEWLDSL